MEAEAPTRDGEVRASVVEITEITRVLSLATDAALGCLSTHS